MKVLFYSAKDYELPSLKESLPDSLPATFTPSALSIDTVSLARGYDAVSIFTSDDASAQVLRGLALAGVRFVATRSAGFDHINMEAASEAGIRVAHVPDYSPHAIAEHAVALMLALDRRLVRAAAQVAENDFTIDHLVGFNMHGKKVGIIGTGHIGATVARILDGFGCTLMAYDPAPDASLEERYNLFYTGLQTLCSMCDIITLHLPLNPQTRHIIGKKLISGMKRGMMLINTARGGILDTKEVIGALRTGQIGMFGMDVYEHERGLFFNDWRGRNLDDPMLKELLSRDNVLLTPHLGFATREAIAAISTVTCHCLATWAAGERAVNEIGLSGSAGLA
ncbi:MAG: D-lactate dehydrogenase [Flaviaesturariibacter sp.]|nr:D-lactate dehydrogenase [Flaviaesturariibacter sp.]